MNSDEKTTPSQTYPVIVISIDGCDGAGKSTLLKNLESAFKDKYTIIIPPKSTALGLMPDNLNDRIKWFAEADPFVSARIYLCSQSERLNTLKSYNKRAHFALSALNRTDKPALVLWDRGIISAKAYAYASIKVGGKYNEEAVTQFIDGVFSFNANSQQICCFSLYPQCEEGLEKVLKRATINSQREESLIRGQIEYFQKYVDKKDIKQFNPLSDPKDISSIAIKIIEDKINSFHKANLSVMKSLTGTRVYLSKILEQLDTSKLKGTITIAGGIVEKGYSDNDIDIVIQSHEDKKILEDILLDTGIPLHFYDQTPAEHFNHQLTISPYKNDKTV